MRLMLSQAISPATGDNVSILLQDTVVQHPHLFGSSHQLLTPTWRSGRGNSPQKYASIECLVSNGNEDQQGEDSECELIPYSSHLLFVTCSWYKTLLELVVTK